MYLVLFFYVKSKMLFSCIITSSLSYGKILFSKKKLVKTSLRTQWKQTNLENWLYVSKELPKKGFDDTVFQNFVDGLKNCNSDMRVEMSKEKIDFRKKKENNSDFYSIAYFFYYKL